MCHLSDVEAWRHFYRTYPDSAAEPRNVRLGLCTNGFAPHRQSRSCRIYGILCTDVQQCEERYIHDVSRITVDCERPTRLWDGISMEFNGVIGYPVCVEYTRAFYLQNGRKTCYFDYHGQFLPPDHPYRRNKKAFIRIEERKVMLPRFMREHSPAVEVSFVTRGWLRQRA
ncbi:UNVERIFIED_CONTAM: hypothetical protein Scaly_1627900 [Sesamum calycinum]|uniref:Uncharacterized protein n=1 Tax=Sesamum calycinum TaxID=2727403 RepID=A0AAW2PBJ6_9LAMI